MKYLTASVLFANILGAVAAPPHAIGDVADNHTTQKHETLRPGELISGESLYQLKIDLVSQDGEHTSLAALRGQPRLVTMFYSSCDAVCPVIVSTLHRMEAALTPAQRRQLRVLMVSLDPERDTPEALKTFARTHKIDDQRWLLARAPENQIRELAAVLGIRYRELDKGMFNHSTVIVLLDDSGIAQAHTSTLAALDQDFMKKLAQVLTDKTR